MDKRRAPRNRSLLQGRVVYNDGLASMDCVVRNQSPGGMRLAISQAVILPDEFDLHIPKKNEVHRVRMRWRSADEVGVAYVRASDVRFAPVARAGPPPARLDEIDSEIARLKDALTALQQERDGMRAALAEREQGEFERVAPPVAQTAPTAIADVFDETTGEWVPASHAPRPRWACR
jgi:hypothetical protein